MSAFRDEVDRLLRDGLGQLGIDAGEPRESSGEPVTVRKLSAYMPVSCCQLTDATGENHCDHPAPPRPPWHRRLRWRIASRWAAIRLRLGSWVAGVDLDEREEW